MTSANYPTCTESDFTSQLGHESVDSVITGSEMKKQKKRFCVITSFTFQAARPWVYRTQQYCPVIIWAVGSVLR
jgi:hypothetical protein